MGMNVVGGERDSGLYLVGGDFGYGGGVASPVPLRNSEQLSQEYLDINYGVDKWIKQENSDDFFIDADAGPVPEVDPLRPEEYISKATSLRERIRRQARTHTLSLEQEIMHDCLVAGETYLFEKYIRDDGLRMPLPEYYAKLMGDALLPMSKADLEEPKQDFLRLLSASGYRYNPNDEESIREAYEQYHNEHKFSQPEVIEARFRNFDRSLGYRVNMALGLSETEDFDYELKWRYEEAQWLCWERVENGKRRVDLNSAHLEEWNWGEAERYPFHEVEVHLKTFDHQFKQVEKGNLDKSMKIILIPSPTCWIGEGIAQTADAYSGISLSLDGQLSVAKYRTYMRAKSQAGYRMGVEGADLDTIILETMPFAPHKSEEQVRTELLKIRDDALWRAYGIVYGRSDVDLDDLRKRLDSSGRLSVLKNVYDKPMTRAQFFRLLPTFLID